MLHLPEIMTFTTLYVTMKAAHAPRVQPPVGVTSLPVMAAPVALVQGASRGLGLQFCKHILTNRTAAAVIATCRNPGDATELRGLAERHPGRLTVLRLDVNREEEVRGAAERVRESFGRLDLVVNSSAMLHPSGKGETSLRDVSAQVSRDVMTMSPEYAFIIVWI